MTEGKNVKKYRFNIVDVILILVIISAITVVVYVLSDNNIFKSKNNTTILYKVEIPLIKNDYLPEIRKLQVGDTIVDSVRGYDIGVLESIEITDAMANTNDMETGVVIETEYIEFSKIVFTIRAECQREEARYIVNGKTIMVGVKVDFRTPYLVNSGMCTYLEDLNIETTKDESGK